MNFGQLCFFHKFIHFTDIFKMITLWLYLVHVSHPQTCPDASIPCRHHPNCKSQVSDQNSEGNAFQPVGGAFSSTPLVVSSATTLVRLLIIALLTYNLPLVYLQTSLYILDIKTINNLIFKKAEDLNRCFSKETYRWATNT